jgi:hypothetical protein
VLRWAFLSLLSFQQAFISSRPSPYRRRVPASALDLGCAPGCARREHLGHFRHG